ncbi:RNA polymerase subunit sigma-70, partial [Rhodococcus hoagii]|nr:RNA polymerase subunit sigma-70 [Prescottella equi]
EPDPAPRQDSVPGIISFERDSDIARRWPFRRRR